MTPLTCGCLLWDLTILKLKLFKVTIVSDMISFLNSLKLVEIVAMRKVQMNSAVWRRFFCYSKQNVMVKIFLYGWNWRLRNHSEKPLTDLLTLQVHRFQVISTRRNKKFLWFSVLKNLVLKLLSKIPSSTLSSSCIKLFLPLQMILQVNLNSIIKKSELPVSKLSLIPT